METVNFNEVDFDILVDNTVSLGWDVENGYTITVWERIIGSKDNKPFLHAALPTPFSTAIQNYLREGINKVL